MTLQEAWENRYGKTTEGAYIINFLREQDTRLEAEKAEAVRTEALKVLDEVENRQEQYIPDEQILNSIRARYERK